MEGMTGVSLEQNLGLTGLSRGRPGRRPGGESAALHRPGFDSTVGCPGAARAKVV